MGGFRRKTVVLIANCWNFGTQKCQCYRLLEWTNFSFLDQFGLQRTWRFRSVQCCPGGPLGGQKPLAALFSALNTEKRPPGCRTAASGGRPLRICVIAGCIECWPVGWWPGGWRGRRGGEGWWSGGPGSPPPHPKTTLHHPRHKSIRPIVLNIACWLGCTVGCANIIKIQPKVSDLKSEGLMWCSLAQRSLCKILELFKCIFWGLSVYSVKCPKVTEFGHFTLYTERPQKMHL